MLDPVTGAAGVLLNEVDVTRRVVAEQARAAAEQKAAMAEARQRFLTDMSHELRTPLNAVIGFSGLLKISNLTPVQIEQAGRIHESGEHLLRVVNEMIRLSESDGWDGEPAEATAPGTPPLLDDPHPGPPPRSDQAIIGEDQYAGRVLYVDDNANNRALVAAILTSQGIDCQTADDGSEGSKAAGTGEWDLILMDIQMPLMDGVQAARAIRALPGPARSVPILAVTANTLPNQLETYTQAGMDDYIAKPINMALLLQKVNYWRYGRTPPEARATEEDGAAGDPP